MQPHEWQASRQQAGNKQQQNNTVIMAHNNNSTRYWYHTASKGGSIENFCETFLSNNASHYIWQEKK
jgi:hypothetical protein